MVKTLLLDHGADANYHARSAEKYGGAAADADGARSEQQALHLLEPHRARRQAEVMEENLRGRSKK